jgi:hypothetical protein
MKWTWTLLKFCYLFTFRGKKNRSHFIFWLNLSADRSGDDNGSQTWVVKKLWSQCDSWMMNDRVIFSTDVWMDLWSSNRSEQPFKCWNINKCLTPTTHNLIEWMVLHIDWLVLRCDIGLRRQLIWNESSQDCSLSDNNGWLTGLLLLKGEVCVLIWYDISHWSNNAEWLSMIVLVTFCSSLSMNFTPSFYA